MNSSHGREESLSFSLAELARMECQRQSQVEERERRVRAERLEAERRAAEAQRQHEREQADARRREAEQVDARRRAAESVAREHAAARSQVEAELRVQLADLERRYVDALACVREREGVSDGWRLVVASWVFAAVVCLGAVVIVVAMVRPEASRRVAAAEAEAAGRSSEIVALRRRAEDAEHEGPLLRARLDQESQRVTGLEAALDAARAPGARPPKATRAPSGPATTAPPAPRGPFGTNCPPDSRDPLCGFSR